MIKIKWLYALISSLLAHFLLFGPGLIKYTQKLEALEVLEKNTSKGKKIVVSAVPKLKPSKPKTAKYLAEFDQETKKESKSLQKSNSPKYEQKEKIISSAKKNNNVSAVLPENPQAFFSAISQNTELLDALPNVERGSDTLLNTWQWKHAPFFNRVKSKVSQIWAPQKQISIYDPKGLLLGNQDRTTVLDISIDKSGFLKKIRVLEGSGVAYLDEEAKRAFKLAAPFLRPPQELFGNKDEFNFRFSFYLYLNRGFHIDFNW